MTGTKIPSIFVLLLVTIIIQEAINVYLHDTFILGIIPTLLFGTIWNFKNGEFIYVKAKNKIALEIKKFRTVGFMTIIYLVLYIIALNVFAWPPDKSKLAVQSLFFPLTGLTIPFAVYACYINITFVITGLSEFYLEKNFKLKAAVSLLLFPLGIFWIQPKINHLKSLSP